NDAVEVDCANRAAALLEKSPASFLDLALEYPHARRGGGECDALRADAHCLRRYFQRLGLADLIAALPGTHLRGAHRGRADTMGTLIDLDRYLDIIRRGTKFDHGLEGFATNPLEILRLRIGNDALDDLAHQGKRDADRGDDFGVFRYLVAESGAARSVRDQGG